MRPLLSLAFVLAVSFPAARAATLSAPAGHQPLRVRELVDPEYPITNDTANLPEGEVHLVIAVEADGTLSDWLVTRYTHAEFADAAVAAVRQWKFEPARREGVAVGVRREIAFTFEPSKTVVSFVEADQIARRLDLAFGSRVTRAVVPAGELDQPLRPTLAPQPPNPSGRGRAVLDFFVDTNGRPRLPVVVSSDAPEFATAALTALDQWRFAPPVARGEPVAVRVRQEFRF